jgi:hypothetical protein
MRFPCYFKGVEVSLSNSHVLKTSLLYNMITKAPHLDAFCLCLYFILLKNCYFHLFKTGSLCISVA